MLRRFRRHDSGPLDKAHADGAIRALRGRRVSGGQRAGSGFQRIPQGGPQRIWEFHDLVGGGRFHARQRHDPLGARSTDRPWPGRPAGTDRAWPSLCHRGSRVHSRLHDTLQHRPWWRSDGPHRQVPLACIGLPCRGQPQASRRVPLPVRSSPQPDRRRHLPDGDGRQPLGLRLLFRDRSGQGK